MSDDLTSDQRLDALVAIRAAGGAKPPSPRDLARALAPYAPAGVAATAWAAAVFAAAERVRVATPDRAAAAHAATAALRLVSPPTWRALVDKLLPAMALGIAPGERAVIDRLADRDALAAAIAGRDVGLWLDGPPPSASALSAAIVWRGLGLSGKPKPTPPEIRAHFLGLLLGHALPDPQRALRQLAVRAVGAARADGRALREALVRRWLAAAAATSGARGPGSTVDDGAPAAPSLTGAALVAAVRAVLADPATPRWSERKVFVSDAWQALPANRPSLDAFKRALIDAHRAGALELARADLTSAMPTAQVAASEIAHLESTYHFLVRETP